MTTQKSQSGSALIIILVILGVLVVLSGLGYVLWGTYLKPAPVEETETAIVVEGFCADGEDEAATNGIFCSEEIGVKFTVPAMFKAKLVATDNYEVFEGGPDPDTRVSAGVSEKVFEAEITGTDNFTFTISKEPLRSGDVGVADKLSPAEFDKDTGVLTSNGEDVDSFMIGDVRIFKGLLGDAGVSIVTYFAVINDKIVKITLHHEGYMGPIEEDPSTIEAGPVYDELDAAIKAIQIFNE